MNDIGYILGGWGLSLAVIGLYAQRLLARGRRLTDLVPPERRRWIDSDD